MKHVIAKNTMWQILHTPTLTIIRYLMIPVTYLLLILLKLWFVRMVFMLFFPFSKLLRPIIILLFKCLKNSNINRVLASKEVECAAIRILQNHGHIFFSLTIKIRPVFQMFQCYSLIVLCKKNDIYRDFNSDFRSIVGYWFRKIQRLQSSRNGVSFKVYYHSPTSLPTS